MDEPSAYEVDINGQPGALRDFAVSQLPTELSTLDLGSYDRVVLTGMGSSHFASQGVWRSLVAQGLPAWWVNAAQLLDLPELATRGSLLWATSQSGESAEVVALIDRLGERGRPRTLLATTNDPASHLALAADIVINLHAGEEATVSTKSYVTTLAAHERALAALQGADDDRYVAQVLTAADDLERFRPDLSGVAAAAWEDAHPRFVLIAGPSEAPSALTGALILKEAAKVPAEGFLRGEFRHGPIELAGPGLTAVLFGTGAPDNALSRMGQELNASRAQVVEFDTAASGTASSRSASSQTVPGSLVPPLFASGATSALGRAACAAKLVQLLSVELARRQGLVPGAFRFGAKITSSL